MQAQTKVLIVDDNPVDREAVIRLLGDRYHFMSAATGFEGVELCRSAKPQCVLLDYRLPDHDGVTFLPRFLEERVGVVMITGVDDRSVAVQSLRAGAHDYLSKMELTRDNLERAVRNACEKADLMRTLDLYRRVVEHMPIGVVVAKWSGPDEEESIFDVLWQNPEAEQRFGTDVPRSSNLVEEAIPQLAGTPVLERLDQAMWSGRSSQVDELVLGDRYYQLRIAPLSHQLVALLFNDITERTRSYVERQKMEAELRASQRLEAVGRLAGGLAHDFNNMLTVIKVHAELLGVELAGRPDEREHVEGILAAADRSAHLTRQLLAYGRRQIRELRVVNLNDVVRDIDAMLARLIGEDVELSTILDPRLASTEIDPWQMQQVIVNLVINARDAMPEGGKLTVETANVEIDEAFTSRKSMIVPPGPYVLLAVTDTGVGMDEETLEYAFEPFFTTKPLDKGTGLGLSMVFGVVKQSGGYIWIYSEVGRGTSVKIYLPIHPDSPTTWRTNDAKPAKGTSGGETILVLEDDERVRNVACRILKKGGYVVLEAGSGDEALRVARAHPGPIAMLLTDVVMPGMSGKDASIELMKSHPDLRVLYMSGYTDNAIVNHGVLDPGTSFLSKPFSKDQLLEKVRAVLDDDHGGSR